MFEHRRLPDGTRLLIETLGRPTVYLDNWALNDIATTSTLCSRFVSAMTRKAGTLRISISNIVELLKQTDYTQIKQILHVIDAVDTGLININFGEVIQRENQLLVGTADCQNPSQELTVLYDFHLALNWPKDWSVSDVVRHVLANSDNSAFVQSYDSFAEKMKAFFSACRADPEYVKKSLARSRSGRWEEPKYCAATRELVTYCCSIRVETSAPEVFLIARHLKALPHFAQVELIAKLATHAEAARGVREKDYFLQCPLLDNEQCSIYSARPTMCRKFLSIDVEKCKKSDPLFPQDSEMVRKSAAMICGTAQAYARAKLHNQYVELGQALLLALTDPTAEDRWYRGEQVFEPVPEKMDDEQQRRT